METNQKYGVTPRIYLGPMSGNIVDAVINHNNNNNIKVGLIASRRQIDFYGGYVNNWKTSEFIKYIKDQSKDTLVCRDHGGIGQGKLYDDGTMSLSADAVQMDIIHIDPFKILDIEDAINYTVTNMEMCYNINPNCLFEIGTEEGIRPYTSEDLDHILSKIKELKPNLFDRIVYGVIQSGTSLKSGVNTGKYNKDKLVEMVGVCEKHGVLSKEHNGDYLSKEEVKEKFKLGLSAINIAPEMGNIQSQHILENISEEKMNLWFDLLYEQTHNWKKWFPDGYDPKADKYNFLHICGHYVFSNLLFHKVYHLPDTTEYMTQKITEFINLRVK